MVERTQEPTDGMGGTDEQPASDPSRPAADHGPTALGLVRQGWQQLRTQPLLVSPFLLVTLLLTIGQFGITTRQTQIGQVPRFEAWVWGSYFAAFLVAWVGVGTVFVAATDRVRGIDRSFGGQVILAMRRLPTMVIAGIIGGIPIAAGLFALVLPGVYLLGKLSLTFPDCVSEDVSAVQALRRSWVFTDGRLTTIFGLYITFAAVMVGLSTVVTAIFKTPGSAPGLVGPLVHNLATAVILPTFGLAFGHLYLSSH